MSRARRKGGKTRAEKAAGQWEEMRPGRQAFGALQPGHEISGFAVRVKGAMKKVLRRESV